MNTIHIMGKQQIYLLPNEPIPEKFVLDGISWVVKFFDPIPAQYFDHSKLRAIVIRSYPVNGTGNSYLEYIYWYKAINLNNLDEKITMGDVSESDFDNAIITRYQIVVCFDGCGTKWHALVTDTSEALISDPQGQNSAKLNQLSLPICPVCGTRFRIPVTKIFGKV